ncbi:MAG TPA: type II toxin-antitoxin system HigB family toxin [Tepidisphaeraceae bacterium]|jgi:mRNA interferase HigB|nr:type II toxin-antitoxin system HigB family toxin [Tepidisphaeraceae bacterium]
MRVAQLHRLAEFGSRHADAVDALRAWARTASESNWRSLLDVRKTYRQADGAKVAGGKIVTIFNIKGNHYRLVTAIDYALGVINVLRVLTHAEYGKDRWKDSL